MPLDAFEHSCMPSSCAKATSNSNEGFLRQNCWVVWRVEGLWPRLYPLDPTPFTVKPVQITRIASLLVHMWQQHMLTVCACRHESAYMILPAAEAAAAAADEASDAAAAAAAAELDPDPTSQYVAQDCCSFAMPSALQCYQTNALVVASITMCSSYFRRQPQQCMYQCMAGSNAGLALTFLHAIVCMPLCNHCNVTDTISNALKTVPALAMPSDRCTGMGKYHHTQYAIQQHFSC